MTISMNWEETVIGRQKFIAELAKLLSGMTARDRESTLAKYNDMFDKAGNEEELLTNLGSPTRVAICELRGYIPSEEPEPESASSEIPDCQAAPDGLIEPEPIPEPLSEEPAGESPPATDVSDGLVEYFRATPRPAEPEDEPVPDPAPEESPRDGAEDGDPDTPEPAFDRSAPEKPRPIAGRIILYAAFGILVCIPVTAVLAALSLCLLALGAGLLSIGIFTVSLSFAGISVFADIMMLIGAGLVIGALGVPVAFLAVWVFLRLTVGFVNLILRTGAKWCYENEKEESQT